MAARFNSGLLSACDPSAWVWVIGSASQLGSPSWFGPPKRSRYLNSRRIPCTGQQRKSNSGSPQLRHPPYADLGAADENCREERGGAPVRQFEGGDLTSGTLVHGCNFTGDAIPVTLSGKWDLLVFSQTRSH